MHTRLVSQNRQVSMRCGLLIAAITLVARISPADDSAHSFGYQQLSRLLDDRPTMKGIFDPHDVVFQWAVKQFNSDCLGKPVYWDPQEPINGNQAENQPAYKDAPAYIRITNSEKVTRYDKWALLVFELNNLKNAKRFIELGDLAIEGKINRDHYAGECVALECKALVLTRMFFQHNAIPGATAQDPYYRTYRYGSGNDNNYMRMLKSSDADPDDNHKYFASWVDSLHRGLIESSSDRLKSQLH